MFCGLHKNQSFMYMYMYDVFCLAPCTYLSMSLRKLAHAIYMYIEEEKIENQKNFVIFLIFCSKHRLWVNVRTASPRRF